MEGKNKISFLTLAIIILIILILGFLIYEVIVTDVFGIAESETSISIGGLLNDYIYTDSSADTTISENISTYEPIIVDDNKDGNDVSTSSANNSYYYNQLNSYGKTIYDAFEENKDNMKSGTYKIDFGTEFNDLLNSDGGEETLNLAFQSAWNAFTYDNMDVFYIDVEKLTLITKTTTSAISTKHTVELSSGNNASYLKENYNTEEKVNNALSVLENMRNEIANQIKQYDDVEKIRQVHNWLINTVEYDTNLEASEPYSIVGALTEGKAVCEGYARAFKYIMDAAGVSCVLVSGTGTNSNGETESHAWNYVQIDDTWYAVDVTWDDPVVIGNAYVSNEDRYANFLKGSTTFYKTHQEDGYLSPNSMEFSFPTLSTTDYPYTY